MSGLPVAVGEIESELRRLWRAAGEGDAGGALTRAQVLNLIIVSEESAGGDPASPDDDEELTEVIAEVTARHPGRVVRIRALPEDPISRLQASLSAFCRPAGRDRKQVCCEEIRLEAQGEAARHLHTTLAALLSEDLPVFLWWRGEPPLGSHRLEELVALADKIIVDSGVARKPREAVVALARWAAAGGGGAGNLAWRRLSPWREAVAALFDAPEQRHLLGRIHQLEVAWGGEDACPGEAQALYLAAWLAARLGWQVREPGGSGEGLTWTLSGPGGPVSVVLRQGKAGEPTVKLGARGVGGSTVIAEVGCGTTPRARLWQAGGMLWERPAPLLHEGTGATLGRELEFRRREPVFAEALARAAEMAGGGNVHR